MILQESFFYFVDFTTTFLVLGQKFVKFFGGFLENFRNQKDILKLTDLYQNRNIHAITVMKNLDGSKR